MVIEVSESQYKPNISEEEQQHSFMFFRSIECIQLEGLLFYFTGYILPKIWAFKYFFFHEMMVVTDGALFISNLNLAK